jgi:hypothetical protein
MSRLTPPCPVHIVRLHHRLPLRSQKRLKRGWRSGLLESVSQASAGPEHGSSTPKVFSDSLSTMNLALDSADQHPFDEVPLDERINDQNRKAGDDDQRIFQQIGQLLPFHHCRGLH